MIVVADESIDFGLVIELRHKGFTVLSVSENFPGISDEEVLKIAVNHQSLIITEDKDFGELTFRLKFKHFGILLLSLSDLPRTVRIGYASDILTNHIEELLNNFSVLNKKGLRIKSGRMKLKDRDVDS
jgi:predicted nuclease of predicted toxin-antitoxin system